MYGTGRHLNMISTFFIAIGAGLLALAGAIFPLSTGLDPNISSALISLAGFVNAFSYIFPVTTLFLAVGVILGFESLWWFFWGLIWVWKRIPFIGK
jgi:hypothetical protein